MIIDCHARVFAAPRLRPRPETTTFMSAEQQIAVMNAKGVDKTVILPLCNPEGSAEHRSLWEILHVCEMCPGRFIPFCNVDPRRPRIPDRIPDWRRTAAFQAMRR